MLTRPCIPLSLLTIPKLMVTASVHCHHSAMFSKMLGLQFGPAVLIETSLLDVASLNFNLEMTYFHLMSFR